MLKLALFQNGREPLSVDVDDIVLTPRLYLRWCLPLWDEMSGAVGLV